MIAKIQRLPPEYVMMIITESMRTNSLELLLQADRSRAVAGHEFDSESNLIKVGDLATLGQKSIGLTSSSLGLPRLCSSGVVILMRSIQSWPFPGQLDFHNLKDRQQVLSNHSRSSSEVLAYPST